jgi:hypothetical protein
MMPDARDDPYGESLFRLRWIAPSIITAMLVVPASLAAQQTACAHDGRDVNAPDANVPRSIVGTVFDHIANRPLRTARAHLAQN